MRVKLHFQTLVLMACLAQTPAAFSEDAKCCVDWKKLNLTGAQSQQVQALEQDWTSKYSKLQPQIIESQRKLTRLLADPKSDSLEVMSTQQTLARLKEQLRNEATSNYLRKRALLNPQQQHQLEGMLAQMVAEKQRQQAPTMVQDEQAGFMGLIHKVRWAIEPH